MNTIPEMKPVDSSNVEAVGHHKNELHVRFKGGAHYVYDNVPPDVHQLLIDSDSKGRFIGQHIKGKFAARRLP